MHKIEIQGELNIPYIDDHREYSETLWKDRDWVVSMREKYSFPLTVIVSVWRFFEHDKEKATKIFDKLSRQYNSWNDPKSISLGEH